MPLLFKCLAVDTTTPDSSVIEALAPWIQIFVAVSPSPSMQEAYITLCDRLPQLSEIHVAGLNTSFIGNNTSDWIFRWPQVEVVVLRMASASDSALQLYSAFSVPSLREFIMIAPRLGELSQISLEQMAWENAALEYVLGRVRRTLQVLRVPGESMRLSFLCAAPWPCLTDLALFSECPTYDATWVETFRAMPALSSLALDVAYPRHTTPMSFLPPDAETNLGDVPALHGLILTSPQAGDAFFARLPPSLTEISLREAPRHNSHTRAGRAQISSARFLRHRDARQYDSNLLSSRGALQIFSVLKGGHITRLELVVREDSFEFEMLAQVAEACPTLHWFEFHRYRDVSEDYGGDGRHLEPGEGVPVASLAHSFSAFPSLRTLRLNLDFPLAFDEYTQLESYSKSAYRRALFVQSQAQILADNMPWLVTLSLFTRHWQQVNYWRTWTVESHPAGPVVLNEEISTWGPHLAPEDFGTEQKQKGRIRRVVDRIVHHLSEILKRVWGGNIGTYGFLRSMEPHRI
ncbi:hypothetical protein EXIGLDRAFT_760854 [Exidia glandulosa HHB12029]|uniref:F-box domain-containing protein n=1 Tax=Exidia glandulosa HHB12029 TaxID=1314781 RepID=A0A165NXE4_EXIGL|nr:hypothetical protein EXIGLDRAFT_760854 [Exidia glandulosa HHB12029]